MLALGLALALTGCAGFEPPFFQSSQATPTQRVLDAEWSPETFTLANGMDVLVLPDRRAPVVTHMVWYRVGAADEPEGKSGIAHFLEHLMFKGTEEVAPGQFSRIVARNGGQDNAFTSSDYTGYFQRVAKDRLPLVMRLEADRMTNLTLTDDEVLPERSVVLEERRSRIDNNPSSLLGERMDAAFYPNHPYGIPIIGFPDEIAALDRDDAIAFYETHYTPNNAILVLAGDVSAEEVRPLVEEIYGAVPARFEPPARTRPAITAPPSEARIVLADPRVEQPSLRRYYRAPSYVTAEGTRAEALDLYAQILGGGTTSKLYRRLVVEEAVAAAAGAWYQGSLMGPSRFGVYVVPRPGVDVAVAERALDEALAAALSEGVSDAELDRARRLLIAEEVYARDNQQNLARVYGVGLSIGLEAREIATWPDRIRAMSADEVQAAARAVLDPDQAVTGVLLPGAES